MSLYLRMLGAKVGPQSLLNSFTFGVPELLEIGAHCSVGTFANLANARVEKGRLHPGFIQIGQRSCIDSYAVLEDHTQLGESCHLLGQSTLSSGRSIPSEETWGGAPARKVVPVQARWEPSQPPSSALRLVQLLLFALGAARVSVLFFIPTFPAFPAFMLIDWIDSHFFDLFKTERSGWQSFPIFLLLAIPAALAPVALTVALAGLLRKALPRQKPGRFSIHSRMYLCKWRTIVVNERAKDSRFTAACISANSWSPRFLITACKCCTAFTPPSLCEAGSGSWAQKSAGAPRSPPQRDSPRICSS